MNMISIPDFLLPSLLSVIIFTIFFKKWLSRTTSTTQLRLPPSPSKLPLIGNLHQLGALPHRSLQSLSKHYGGLMLLHLGNVPLLIASSTIAAREILKNQDLIFASRPKLSIPDKLFYGSKTVAFAPYGDYWRQVRSTSVLQLLSKKRVQSFRHVREEETSLMVERIKQLASSSSVVNLSEALVSLTNDIICRVALGRKHHGEGKLSKLLREFDELLSASSLKDYIPWLGWIDHVNGTNLKVEKVFRGFDQFLDGVIEEHRRDRTKKNDEQLDFADILLDQKATAELVDDESVKALIMEIFGAGTDTSASLLTWTMAELISNPKTMNKLQNEVKEIVATKEEITEDDLDKMHYLKAVIKESLRLHPPVPLLLPRELIQHTKVLGYDVPKGTHVMVNAWAIGRDPLLWKSPENFNPERFLDNDVDYKGGHFEFIPFGSGRRGCPGVTFAENIIELAIAKLVHNFDFALPNGESGENLDMTEAYGITIQKRLPLLLITPPRAH